MVYNICVVDDEKYIADVTAARIKNDCLRDINIDVYYSSAKAIQQIHKARVDILIADICMPDVSGLELAEKVRQIWPQCRIIMLTAHAEFDYVYQAIKIPDARYVLKQDGYSELFRNLEEVMEQLEMQDVQQSKLSSTITQAQVAVPWLKREMIMDAVHGITLEESEIADAQSKINTEIDLIRPMFMWFMYCETSNRDSLFTRYEKICRLTEIARDFLPYHTAVEGISIDNTSMLWLVQFADDEPRDKAYFDSVLDAIQSIAMEKEDMLVSTAYSLHMSPYTELSRIYHQLKTLTAQCAVNGGKQWIACLESVMLKNDSSDRVISSIRKWTRSAHGYTQKTQNELEALTKILEEYETADCSEYRHVYIQIASSLFETAQDTGMSAEKQHAAGIDCIYDIFRHASPLDAEEYLNGIGRAILEAYGETASSSTNEIISKVKNYIASHIGEDISLVRLSDEVHVNASYLSRLFKQETGQNLKNYISNMRLDAACRMLAERDMQINDIGKQLGFLAPSYFSYFFRKAMGMSPVEYREKHKIVNGSILK